METMGRGIISLCPLPIVTRLSHKLPLNSQKVADKSVQKLLKSCHFIFKVAEKFMNFEKVAE